MPKGNLAYVPMGGYRSMGREEVWCCKAGLGKCRMTLDHRWEPCLEPCPLLGCHIGPFITLHLAKGTDLSPPGLMAPPTRGDLASPTSLGRDSGTGIRETNTRVWERWVAARSYFCSLSFLKVMGSGCLSLRWAHSASWKHCAQAPDPHHVLGTLGA